MAFEEEIVRDVMRRNIERQGAGYQSAAALLDAVVEFQEWVAFQKLTVWKISWFPELKHASATNTNLICR